MNETKFLILARCSHQDIPCGLYDDLIDAEKAMEVMGTRTVRLWANMMKGFQPNVVIGFHLIALDGTDRADLLKVRDINT